MDSVTRYYLGSSAGNLAVLGLIGYMTCTYRLSNSPQPGLDPIGSTESSPKLSERRVNYTELQQNNPDFDLMIPQTSEDGMPFVLEEASAQANQASKFLRVWNSQQAINQYRMASDIDLRYEIVLKRTKSLAANVKRQRYD